VFRAKVRITVISVTGTVCFFVTAAASGQ